MNLIASTGKRSFQNKTVVQYINLNTDDHYTQHLSFIQIMKVNIIENHFGRCIFSKSCNNVLFKHIQVSLLDTLFWKKRVKSESHQFSRTDYANLATPIPMTQSVALYGLHLIDANRLSVAAPTVVGGTAANSYQKSIFYCW